MWRETAHHRPVSYLYYSSIMSIPGGMIGLSDAVGAPYLTAGQAAKILAVSPKTLTRWANAGRIPCAVTLGGHRRFAIDEIRAVALSMGLGSGASTEGR
jgi:excisionase family DNA binding protein